MDEQQQAALIEVFQIGGKGLNREVKGFLQGLASQGPGASARGPEPDAVKRLLASGQEGPDRAAVQLNFRPSVDRGRLVSGCLAQPADQPGMGLHPDNGSGLMLQPFQNPQSLAGPVAQDPGVLQQTVGRG